MVTGLQSCLTVNGLPLPELLVALIRDGHWVHLGDARLREVIPFLVDPVDFLCTPEAMASESTGTWRMTRSSRPSIIWSVEVG